MKSNNESETLELFLSIYLFFKKFIILLLIFLVLGIAYGVYKNKTYKNTYTKEILIYSEDISYILLKQFTISLAQDIGSGNNKKVSEEMFLDEKIARKILDAKTDSVALKSKVYTMTVFAFSDTTGTSGFSKNYIQFLSSVEYIHNLMEGSKQKYQKILEKIDQKLKELDAIQVGINSKTTNSSPTFLNDAYSEYIDLYSKKIDYEDRIKNNSEIKLIRESTSAVGPRFGMLMSCIIYGMVFFVMSLVIGFFIELFGKIRKLEKSKK
jgi:hypothetical protein